MIMMTAQSSVYDSMKVQLVHRPFVDLFICTLDIILLMLKSFFPTFFNNCGRGKILWTTTCLKTMVGESKGMFLVK